MKNQRFAIESQIISHIYEDNKNTVHFDYHVDIDNGSITLDLYTFNKKTLSVMLLHQTRGINSITALAEMYNYIHDKKKKDKAPYTITWNRVGDEKHQSYFWERSEADAREKFFYNKDEADYEIEIELRPSS